MTPSFIHLLGVFIVGLAIGLYFSKIIKREGFENSSSTCGTCGAPSPCGCEKPEPRPIHPADEDGSKCRQPDMNKYVLKSSIPPCPAVPDLSNYVLKSSIPKLNPILLDCSKCQKGKGECPPCPRARCPELKCPEPTKCPQCAPCPPMKCPPAVVKCKAEDVIYDSPVRPYMAPLNYVGFGLS